MTPDDLNAMEKALAKIEEGVEELRQFDKLYAQDIQNLVDEARADAKDENERAA